MTTSGTMPATGTSGRSLNAEAQRPGNIVRLVQVAYEVLLAPLAICWLLSSTRIHPAYRFGWFARLSLGLRFYWNRQRVCTGTNPKVHLAMALKLLEIPPEIPGVVVECGTWKGGTAVNLSLICRLIGRRLWIYDSFQGLPPADPRDREGPAYAAGDYCGTLEEVKSNLERYGAPEVCTFVEGWFEDTLPELSTPVVLAYVDVDLEYSLHTCVLHLWRNLDENGYVFIDEAVGLNYSALFFSERWWGKYFRRTPPGLIGAGTGLPMGNFYVGPYTEHRAHRWQRAGTGAYTCKSFSGYWPHFPESAGEGEP